jgi:hypothetical protein
VVSTFILAVSKIIFVIIILGGIVLLLIGMNHFLLHSPDMDDKNNFRFRHELESEDKGLSDYNFFKRFIWKDKSDKK